MACDICQVFSSVRIEFIQPVGLLNISPTNSRQVIIFRNTTGKKMLEYVTVGFISDSCRIIIIYLTKCIGRLHVRNVKLIFCLCQSFVEALFDLL